MGEMKKELDSLMSALGKFQEHYPEQTGAFMKFLETTEKDGKLSRKTKKLISVALAVTAKCKGCIAFHTHGALKAGATKEEILEAAWVAGFMGGGPAVVHCQYVAEALKEFGK